MNKRKYKKRTPEQLARRREQARLRGPRDRSKETPEKAKAQKQRRCERLYGGNWAEYSRANRKRRAEIAGRAYLVRGTVDDIKKRAAIKQLITVLRRRVRTLQRKPPLTSEQLEQRRLRDNTEARLKYASDAKYAIYHRMKRSIHKHLKDSTASRNWSKYLGYTMHELHDHIERQFTRGMSWHNKGQWHIDHIVPVAAFTFTSVDDAAFRECYALTNLRPMWGAENVRKNDKRVYLL